MPHRYITSGPDLFEAPSPISQAVVANDHCYVSGQLATDATGCFQTGSVVEEAGLAFRNLFKALELAGFTRDDVVFVDVALLDLADLPQVNDVWAGLFAAERRPARTVYQVAALPYGGKIKVQAIAVR
jgi:2-iminobutanoate/2-iminopropanoate deaminase